MSDMRLSIEPHNMQIWGMIQAEMVRVEAMKAANQECEYQKKPMDWGYQPFADIAAEIDQLARSFE